MLTIMMLLTFAMFLTCFVHVFFLIPFPCACIDQACSERSTHTRWRRAALLALWRRMRPLVGHRRTHQQPRIWHRSCE